VGPWTSWAFMLQYWRSGLYYIRLLQALSEFMTATTGQESHSLDAEELIEQLEPYLKPVLDFVETADDADFTKRFKQPFGSGGPPRYFFQLVALVRAKYPDFKPAGYDDFITEQTAEVTQEADARNKSIVDRVHKHVVSVLRANWGGEFFDRGIPQKDIKLAAMNKMYDDKEKQMPPETYLDVIELKKVVEHQQNWEMFKETLSIQLPDERKGQAKYLKWMERLNEVRRIAAHPFGRTYKADDLDFLEFIDEQLQARNV
jgi:DNA sulfur modification protein DndB